MTFYEVTQGFLVLVALALIVSSFRLRRMMRHVAAQRAAAALVTVVAVLYDDDPDMPGVIVPRGRVRLDNVARLVDYCVSAPPNDNAAIDALRASFPVG